MDNKIEPGIASKEIFNLFKEYRSNPFIFVEPGGNYGDYLIYKGAQKLADVVGIDYTTVTHDEFMKCDYQRDHIIYIHGSGGCTPLWGGIPLDELKKAVSTHRGVIILGPQTFTDDQKYIQAKMKEVFQDVVSERVCMYARDLVSYSALGQHVPKYAELGVDHDTALNLSAKDIMVDNHSGRFALYAIRTGTDNVKVTNPNVFGVCLDPVRYCVNLEHWIFLHSKAKMIVTNRLHSAVVGSILGIPTTIWPNIYHKNRSTWEYSLRQRGVLWEDTIPVNYFNLIANRIYPLYRIVNSYRIQQALKALYCRFYGIRCEDFLKVNSC